MKPSEEAQELERVPINPAQVSVLNQIKHSIHTDMQRMGWHDDQMSDLEFIKTTVANIHGEVSELWEAARKGQLDQLCDKAAKMESLGLEPLRCLEEELADIVIRVMDTAGRLKVDLGMAVALKQELNMSRGYRYGGKLA